MKQWIQRHPEFDKEEYDNIVNKLNNGVELTTIDKEFFNKIWNEFKTSTRGGGKLKRSIKNVHHSNHKNTLRKH